MSDTRAGDRTAFFVLGAAMSAAAARRGEKSASLLLTASIVFGVAPGEPFFCAQTRFFTAGAYSARVGPHDRSSGPPSAG